MIKRRNRARDESTIDITPMLDIVFIMLIFFIVTTSFVKETGVEVNRPNASTAVRDESCLLYTSPSPRDLSTSRMPSSA